MGREEDVETCGGSVDKLFGWFVGGEGDVDLCGGCGGCVVVVEVWMNCLVGLMVVRNGCGMSVEMSLGDTTLQCNEERDDCGDLRCG
ncbi:hypothetical protein Pmani_040007 [Petrolisthes manimaculis]|uniref:Uncharacterized protein n=1 Tax=Petrolisthes manimaculis TaxID=1843537 RepID=A0AAE1ND12_9EUCA|nr:hypothetical protein Pmani_040007 [Petrolisthes manimaculis]